MNVIRYRTVIVGATETRQYGYFRDRAYQPLVSEMHTRFHMPQEILDQIFEAAGHIVWFDTVPRRSKKNRTSLTPASLGQHMAATPPADESCPFIDKLPFEIRKIIFRDSLPSRSLTIDPTCESAHNATTVKGKRRNPLVNLMLISKKMCDEVAGIAYEERTFGIHVHQGFQNAGIEFLHVGRQPLHFLDNASDRRFTKFRPGDRFGFCRLKRIEIQIFPYDGAEHHTAINTYFMNIALVRLLERNPEKREDRITTLRIVFVEDEPRRRTRNGRSAIMAAETSSWWDQLNDCPRESSIHGISDIELVLRPFVNLSHVHQVDIQLPARLRRHIAITNFVVSLQRCMTAKTLNLNTFFDNDDIERQIESHRFGLEEIVIRNKYGGDASTQIPKLDDHEMKDAEDESPDSGNDGDGNDNDSGHDDDGDHDNENIMNPPIRSRSGDNQQVNNERRSNTTNMQSAFESFGGASFEDNGGYADDLDNLDDMMPVAPNATSEKVARFCEWFGVDGDVARRWLSQCGDDLSGASDLYISSLDANDAVPVPNLENLTAPDATSEKVASFCEWFGVDENRARRWLIFADYDLSRASELYIASQSGDSAAPTSNFQRPTALRSDRPHHTSLPIRGRREQKRSVGVSNDFKASSSGSRSTKGKERAMIENHNAYDRQPSHPAKGRDEPSHFYGPPNDWKLDLSSLNPNKGKKRAAVEDDNMHKNGEYGNDAKDDEEDDQSPRTPKMARIDQVGHNMNDHRSTYRNRQGQTSKVTETHIYAPLDVPSDLSMGKSCPTSQQPTAARNSSAAQDHAQWANRFWADSYGPISSQTRAADISLVDLGGLAHDGSSLVDPTSLTTSNNARNSAFATPSRQSSLPNTHVNGMAVDDSEDSPPGGVALNPEQVQDLGFWQQSRHTYHGMLNFRRGKQTD